ncbi:MAG: response regulator [Burkholderiaceae bacterium]
MLSDKIKVLLVDDHAIARNGVKLMLEAEADIEIAGEAVSARQALNLVNANDYDVALMDISLNEDNGLELLRILRNDRPELKVLMLSSYAEDIYGVRALKLGAAGYLNKSVEASTLAAAIRKAAAGRRYISTEIAEKLVGMVSGEEKGALELLSNREIEILKLIASGHSLVSIAEKLHISRSTVTSYRQRILEKTGLHSNADLAHYARDAGLLH